MSLPVSLRIPCHKQVENQDEESKKHQIEQLVFSYHKAPPGPLMPLVMSFVLENEQGIYQDWGCRAAPMSNLFERKFQRLSWIVAGSRQTREQKYFLDLANSLAHLRKFKSKQKLVFTPQIVAQGILLDQHLLALANKKASFFELFQC